MKVSLSLDTESPRSIVVTFQNDTFEVEYLAKARAFAIEPDGDHFQIEPPAPYLGVASKRSPYEHDELLAVDPGRSQSYSLDLDTMYDFGDELTGRRIRYSASQPLEGNANMTFLQSEWLELL